MKKCEIWTLTEQGQELMGNVLLDGATLSCEYTPGNEDAMSDLMEDVNFSGDTPYDVHSDPVAWFEALPQKYHGTRMWAQMAKSSMQPIPDGK